MDGRDQNPKPKLGRWAESGERRAGPRPAAAGAGPGLRCAAFFLSVFLPCFWGKFNIVFPIQNYPTKFCLEDRKVKEILMKSKKFLNFSAANKNKRALLKVNRTKVKD